jgi:hypothetical protein
VSSPRPISEVVDLMLDSSRLRVLPGVIAIGILLGAMALERWAKQEADRASALTFIRRVAVVMVVAPSVLISVAMMMKALPRLQSANPLAVLAACIMAWTMCEVREANRRLYGAIEIAFGLALASVVSSELRFRGVQGNWLAYFAAIYVIIRGLTNWREARAAREETPAPIKKENAAPGEAEGGARPRVRSRPLGPINPVKKRTAVRTADLADARERRNRTAISRVDGRPLRPFKRRRRPR